MFNMQSHPSGQMTVDEFLHWAEAQGHGHFELHDGRVIVFPPENAEHWTAKGATYAALHSAINAAGISCHPVPRGAAVEVSREQPLSPMRWSIAARRWRAIPLRFQTR